MRVKISLKILEDNFAFLLAYHLREKMRGGGCMLTGWNYRIPIAVNMPVKVNAINVGAGLMTISAIIDEYQECIVHSSEAGKVPAGPFLSYLKAEEHTGQMFCKRCSRKSLLLRTT